MEGGVEGGVEGGWRDRREGGGGGRMEWKMEEVEGEGGGSKDELEVCAVVQACNTGVSLAVQLFT